VNEHIVIGITAVHNFGEDINVTRQWRISFARHLPWLWMIRRTIFEDIDMKIFIFNQPATFHKVNANGEGTCF